LGQEIRKLILDGVPPHNITIIDIHDQYWNYGKRLFLDAEFINHNQLRTIFADLSKDSSMLVDIHDLATNQYQYALLMAVVDCLSENEVIVFLRNTFQLLKSDSKAKLIGWTVGKDTEGSTTTTLQDGCASNIKTPKGDALRFLHTTKSLQHLLIEIGFVNITIHEEPLGDSLEKHQTRGYPLSVVLNNSAIVVASLSVQGKYILLLKDLDR